MTDHDTVLVALESAERSAPACTLCGQPTLLNTHDDGSIWLECAALTRSRSPMRRALAAAVPHYRRSVVDAAA